MLTNGASLFQSFLAVFFVFVSFQTVSLENKFERLEEKIWVEVIDVPTQRRYGIAVVSRTQSVRSRCITY